MTTPNSQPLEALVDAMKEHHLRQGPPNLATRSDRLGRAIQLLSRHREALVDTISADFGYRSPYVTMAADIMASIKTLSYARENLAQWMQSETVPSGDSHMTARVEYQPLGVVGIISPWNFPLNLAFGPMAGALAAGNSVLLKPSELTPATAELLAELIARYFDPLELNTVFGDAAVGAAFSAQAFDHLVFTGSTGVGRHIMRAASDNLVPVTLELGGKSPVMVDIDADIEMVAERVLTIKAFNAGQICLAPDYVLMPDHLQERFVARATQFIDQSYPSFLDSPDTTSIISERHYQRLLNLIEDARNKGGKIIQLGQSATTDTFQTTRKMPITLILNANDGMSVMQEEIFGPVLPVLSYQNREQALQYINSHPRPLAAYYFGTDSQRQSHFSQVTTSGGLVINDVMTHVSIEGLPFGGVGPAGMGAYHGIHGFRRFSHAKAVVEQGGEYGLRLRAPFGPKLDILKNLIDQAN
jgi:coniferyl-aldehyde dehydrogenase